MRANSSRLGIAMLTTMALGIVACSNDNDGSSTTLSDSTVAADQPLPPSHSADGTLTLGLLVPESDPNASFGTQLVPLVEALVRIMNSFGGFNERPLQLVVRDEGSTPESARKSAEQLTIDDGVDMVIGPYSAINAPAVLPTLISAGVGVCSPAISSPIFDTLHDAGLFIRTGIQDAAIISNMVELAVQSGSEVVSVAYPDDPYGRALVRLLRSDLRGRDLAIISDIAYAPETDDFGEIASELVGDSARVELIIANPTRGPKLLNALVAVSQDSRIITNDLAISAPLFFQENQPKDLRPQVFGFAPDVEVGSDELLNVVRLADPTFAENITELPPYSVNTVDCLLLAWLSALIANSDSAEVFRDEFLRVANDGATCLWVPDCKFAADENVNFNYEGIAGLNLDSQGNPFGRSLLLYQYDSDGRAQIIQGAANIGFTG